MIRNLILTLALVSYANAHALMSEPPQRGILYGENKFAPDVKAIPGAPRDFRAHFPSGEKIGTPGVGRRSQIKEARGKWVPYDPFKPGFVFRTGVCGDTKRNGEHLRGGRFYFGGRITRTYRQGGIVKLRQAVIAHHNGYAELYVCDVKKCGGEISEKCFQDRYCYALERAPNPICDGGMSKRCGPIDSKNPTRWYLPCTEQINDDGWDDYRGEYALFELPDFLSCDHCVLQWFYTSANNCNPPGVIEYFKGPDRPRNWGRCKGQAGAIGGFTQVQNLCGEGSGNDRFPEEYYQCADIKIERSGSGSRPPTAPPSTRPPTTRPPTRPPTTAPSGGRSTGVFKHFNFIADGKIVKKFTTSLRVNVRRYRQVAIEAVTSRTVKPVNFYVNNRFVWDESTSPYFLWGNDGRVPRYYSREQLNKVINRTFKLEVRWKRDRMTSRIRMYR